MSARPRSSKKQVHERSLLILKAEAFKRFEQTVSSPPEPNEKLKKAAQARRPWA